MKIIKYPETPASVMRRFRIALILLRTRVALNKAKGGK